MKLLDQIIGYESIKEELYQIVDMFKNKERYKKIGASLPKGVLIYGQPGMGKSMLAKGFIEECEIKSLVLRKTKDPKSTLNDIYSTFETAADLGECIILIDDIDKFSESSCEDVDDEAFVAIQSGIDMVKDKDVLVVATANEYRKLPQSLRRSGRFDRKIAVQTPSSEDARKIIEFYMKDKNVDKSLDYDDVANMIGYTSCADLQTILNESAIYAGYEKKESIDINDIVRAYLRDSYQSPDKKMKCSAREIETTAIHEAGHAVVAEALKKESVGFISVRTSGRSSTDGFTHLCKEFNRRPENILISLGGKAAVELFYEGRCGSGCVSDLSKAINLIRDGTAYNGTYGIGAIDTRFDINDELSQSHLAKLETICQAELERYLFQVRDILLKNKDFLMKIANELKEKEVLLYSDIKRIRASSNIIEFNQVM